jgi:hypothetical protein
MKLTHDIKRLRELYKKNKLVPFTGAGLSMPFNIPSWTNLLKYLNEELIDDEDINDMIKGDIAKGEYWNAMDDILKYSFKDDGYIQKMVADIIVESTIKNIQSVDNNYIDIASLNVPYYLTTNYDNLINRFVDSKYQSTILSDSKLSTQSLSLDSQGKRVFHLHGDISNPGTIVLTKNIYNQLYDSDKYKALFNFFRSGYTYLFIGFSYSDEYIISLMERYNHIFNDYHYILLANPSNELKRKFIEKYNLIIIGYNIEDGKEHVASIRSILNLINKSDDNVNF